MKDEFLLNSGNLEIAEEMYAKYLIDQASVDSSWQSYFKDMEIPLKSANTTGNAVVEKVKVGNVSDLINAYRTHGHRQAGVNPIINIAQDEIDFLNPKTYGLDLQTQYPTNGLIDEKMAPLSKIIDRLKSIYSNKIGIEYMGLSNPILEKFIQERLEGQSKNELTIDEKQMILKKLNQSELLEVFIHTKYVGQKRFSIEGAETLIPILESIIEKGAAIGVDEFFIGMPHRGRLNVLANILNKSYKELFSEFEEGYIPQSFEGSGDVKYHKGFANDVKVKDKTIRVALTPNPSHLESVDAVVLGQVKARQIIKGSQSAVLPILIHGDAAVSGQGVVYETLQFTRLAGYSTGGTLHIVVNNQIGFTTIPRDLKSTLYCTDIAKTFSAPVFHVNGDDPENAIFATLLALEIRQKFVLDVFIDLISYRKYGHNETDEPAFTQPLEYQIIRQKKPVREIYRDQLIEEGALEKEVAEKLESEFKASLIDAQNESRNSKPDKIEKVKKIADSYVKTSVSKELIQQLANKFCNVPTEFNIHPKVKQLISNRLSMVMEDKNIDWAMAETLAYATLLWEGTNVRISGQDCGRGTFSHRHGLLVDQVKEGEYFPLQHLKENQSRFDLINSPLSEFGVLGFEYGYNIMTIEDLDIWEAQFGDFVNSAQVIIDQYIVSAEQKWGQQSSLVMFLPHGFEGQGPEHSSGRMERFLSLAGNDNIVIVNPTTPAQLFHMLRRHILGKTLKPLIVFTPKGLLRHPQCVSRLTDFTDGQFLTLIEDDVKNPKQLIFCSGRIYYDLLGEAKKNNVTDIGIVRIEQLYPIDSEKLESIIKNLYSVEKYYYVQEEPKNMGAYFYMEPILAEILPEGSKLHYRGRDRSASPATGSHALHGQEYKNIMSIMKDNK